MRKIRIQVVLITDNLPKMQIKVHKITPIISFKLRVQVKTLLITLTEIIKIYNTGIKKFNITIIIYLLDSIIIITI